MTDLQDYSFVTSQTKPVKKMVIFLHGYGSDGKDLISIAPIWAEQLPDTVFYAPNAPEACEMSPMGFQWFSLADRSPAAMQKNIAPVKDILDHYISQKCTAHDLSLGDVAIVGFSQGTMSALYAMPQMTTDCAGVLGYSGRAVSGDDFKSRVTAKFPICAVHGTADEVVPFDSLADIKDQFEGFGYDVDTHSRAGLGHGIDQEALRIGETFLTKILK